MGRIMKFAVICLVIATSATSVWAVPTPLILDSTNGWAVTLEPGAIIEQPSFEGTINFITGTNVEFAIGTSDVAVFSGQTQIGGGVGLGGFTPRQLTTGAIPFSILATNTGNVYDATLTFFQSFGGGTAGTAPSPNNNAGAVFNVELATAVPEPATFALGMLGIGSLMLRRRRMA